MRINNEKGSLALEQILFIGAVVALSAGIFTFYDSLAAYFNSFDFTNIQSTVSGSTQTTGTATP